MKAIYLVGGDTSQAEKVERKLGVRVVSHWALISGRNAGFRREPVFPSGVVAIVLLRDSCSHLMSDRARQLAREHGVFLFMAARTQMALARQNWVVQFQS